MAKSGDTLLIKDMPVNIIGEWITSDSAQWQEVEQMLPEIAKPYDGAFLCHAIRTIERGTINGEPYLAIYLMHGIIPYLDKEVLYIHLTRYLNGRLRP